MKNILLFILILLPLASCEKIIDVNLNSADPKYVIEGIITDLDAPVFVKITQTKDFDEDNDFPGIEDASVTISDDNGNVVTLTYVDKGVYQSTELKGIPGTTYSLLVDINGQQFSAVSTMPQPVPIDTIYMNYRKAPFGGDTIYSIIIEYQDPVGIENYFRYIMYLNEKKRKRIYTDSDEYTDGKLVINTFDYYEDDEDDDSPKLKDGDIITIEAQCIDKPVYSYFFELERTITGSGFSSSLSNPPSNIVGGSLGYFSAHTVWTGSVTVKK